MAPEKILSLDISAYPKLSAAQVAHLRHFHNSAFQPDGEWRHMGSQEPAQEFLDAYRYQLATMAYGAGVTHYHRLPALRSVFKPLIRQLIHKMLLRSVWGYWFTTSLSGSMTDPSLQKLRDPWADPVVRENIMYSGHLLLMTSLYAMLFDDNEFEKPNSITFNWDPLFFGMGSETFGYDNRSLQRAITREMERNGWVGVCCEPNLVFIVCNQFPIIGMRYNDIRDGTNIVDDILAKYKAAWDKKGMVMSDGLFPEWWMVKQDHVLPASDVSFTAWACAFMNTWNSSLVYSLYDQQVEGFITNISGQVRIQPPLVAGKYREAAKTVDKTSSPEQILTQALSNAKGEMLNPRLPQPPIKYSKPTLGYVIKWLSELGKEPELSGLLEFIDQNLHPTMEEGGLFYPRNDQAFSSDLIWTHMDPFSGNAAIGYARLNVKDGQKIMWETPWTKDTLLGRPWIDNLDFVKPGSGVAVLRGEWDKDAGALILTVRGWDYYERSCDEQVVIEPVAKNLSEGNWAVYVRGELRMVENVTQASHNCNLGVREVVKRGEEVDIVFVKQ